jgi:hypothetical protein
LTWAGVTPTARRFNSGWMTTWRCATQPPSFAMRGVEPVHMSGDQLRKLLVPSARKVEVFSHCLQAGFELFVVDHPHFLITDKR